MKLIIIAIIALEHDIYDNKIDYYCNGIEALEIDSYKEEVLIRTKGIKTSDFW